MRGRCDGFPQLVQEDFHRAFDSCARWGELRERLRWQWNLAYKFKGMAAYCKAALPCIALEIS